MADNLWVGGDDLLLGLEAKVLLELEIANGSAERQVAIHSAKLNKTTSLHDTVVFCLVAGFVIIAHSLGRTLEAKHATRVTSIGYDDSSGSLALRVAVLGASNQERSNSSAA